MTETDQPQQTALPEWIATMVGQLVLENRGLALLVQELQAALAAAQPPAREPTSNGKVPAEAKAQ